MTDPIVAFGALLLGAVLGSFLNALTFRFNTGGRLWHAMQGRSHCMRCGHTLSAADLVPVVSWLLLRGRCRYCRTPISVQYPLVEAVAALLSLGVALQYFAGDLGGPQLFSVGLYAFWFLVWMVILFLVVYDWRHMILPIEALALLAVLGFASLWLPDAARYASEIAPPTLLWHLLAGFVVALPLTALSAVSRGRWMGWGDGIFALPLGWILGITGGITALMLAFWIGAATGVALVGAAALGKRRGLTLRSALPFGPFLALGAAIVFFAHFDLFTLLGW